jgi:hypothetical protein
MQMARNTDENSGINIDAFRYWHMCLADNAGTFIARPEITTVDADVTKILQ